MDYTQAMLEGLIKAVDMEFKDHLEAKMGAQIDPDGILGMLLKEIHSLNIRLSNLEKDLAMVRRPGMVSSPPVTVERLLTDQQFMRSLFNDEGLHTAQMVADRLKGKEYSVPKMGIEAFKQKFFGDAIKNSTEPPKEPVKQDVKEEAHPATHTSFVLKI
jgi:hypothetical protein